MTSQGSRIHGQRLLWGRALLYGLLTEAILTAIFVAGLAGGMAANGATLIALAGSFVLPLLFATILGRRLQARFVVHGVLIGAAAFAIFMMMNVMGRLFQPDAPPQPVAYWVAHAFKFVGGGLGGAIARRSKRRQAVSEVRL
jgi:hypothetical protein